MRPNPLFPRIIAAYKDHLRGSTGNHLSFNAFCRPYHIKQHSILQWLRRHNLDVSLLHYEVLLEQGISNPELAVHSHINSGKKYVGDVLEKKKVRSIPPEDQLQGVTITFPDGVVITIRLTSPQALKKIIEFQNKLNMCADVHPQ